MPPSGMRRSHRQRRMRSTCRRISSPASATGRNRSAPTSDAARAAKASNEAHDQLHAMDYLVYAYLQMGQDAKAQAVIEEMRGIGGFTETFIAGPYALAGEPGTIRDRARRLERGGAACGEADPAGPRRGHDALRPRVRGGALRQAGRRQGRHRQARGAARQAARGQGCLLGRAGRHPAAGRDRLGALCARASTRRRSRL